VGGSPSPHVIAAKPIMRQLLVLPASNHDLSASLRLAAAPCVPASAKLWEEPARGNPQTGPSPRLGLEIRSRFSARGRPNRLKNGGKTTCQYSLAFVSLRLGGRITSK
jgi:hypothetical protein